MTRVAWRAASVRAGRRTAIDGVTAEAGPGVHAVVGPNGSGKSTLLGVVAGVVRLDAGEVTVAGEAVRLHRSGAACVGWAPQERSLPAALRAREVLRLVAAHRDVRDAAAGEVELGPLAGRQCGGLSGGEARRVSLACAFVGDPHVVLLDEPDAGLDAEHRERLRMRIDDARDRGATVLLATHDLDEVARSADAMTVLAAGRVVASGRPETLLRRLRGIHVSFAAHGRALDAVRTRVREIDAEAMVVEVGGRIVVGTTHGDAVARTVLDELGGDELAVERPTLEHAVRALEAAGTGEDAGCA